MALRPRWGPSHPTPKLRLPTQGTSKFEPRWDAVTGSEWGSTERACMHKTRPSLGLCLPSALVPLVLAVSAFLYIVMFLPYILWEYLGSCFIYVHELSFQFICSPLQLEFCERIRPYRNHLREYFLSSLKEWTLLSLVDA